MGKMKKKSWLKLVKAGVYNTNQPKYRDSYEDMDENGNVIGYNVSPRRKNEK